MTSELDGTIAQFSQLSLKSSAKNELDPAWFIPQPSQQGFVFQCSLSLKELIERGWSETYFRKLLTIVEEERGIVDFHMRLRLENRSALLVDFMYKSNQPQSGPVPTPVCISCDKENPLSKSSLLHENPTTRIWLDAQLREKFIVTPVKHIERLLDLTGDEMIAFWQSTQSFLDQEGCFWQSMVLNHGTYRNHAHLHMKINIPPRLWDQRVRRKYGGKLRQMDHFLNRSGTNSTEKYFGHRQFNQWSGIKKKEENKRW